MATLAAQTINRAGVTESLSAATGGGDAAPCGFDNYLKVANAAGASMTVTIAIPSGASGFSSVSYTNTSVIVPNASHKLIGPLNPQVYQDPTTGLATITYSTSTSVTVGVFNLQEP